MSTKLKVTIVTLLILGVIVAAGAFLSTVDIAVLNPKGAIAAQERDLIILAISLSAIVVIPVFVMLAMFSWKYREGNQKATYRPDWDSNKWLEVVWWGIPCVIILILAVVTWRTSHELDPKKAIASTAKPINIQVVALQWKWLFIYPEQKVASVNELQLPKDTPIEFTVTADAPMNAFWIPHLGSQVYAMSGMSSKLHLIANEEGDYKGSSSNISGKGFADMSFMAHVSSASTFNNWVHTVKRESVGLDQTMYAELVKPGSVKDPAYYVLKDGGLYDSIVMKYMHPNEQTNEQAEQNKPTEHHMHTMTEMGEM